MRGRLSLLLAFFICVAAGPATTHAQSSRPLTIYVVDVEGGNATLFVAPSGQSLLIDTGNGGPAAERDGGRILAAARDAGLTQIDHLITTHWHGDHFGAMEFVASKLPIKHYIDHGGTVEAPAPGNAFVREGYPALYAKATHTVAKPGDRIAISGLDWRIVAAAGQHITTPLPGLPGLPGAAGAGKPNRTCADYKAGMPDPTENAQSVGSIVTFGKFRVAHLGDLTWNKEYELMCPNNPIGTVDLFIVSHHGQAISNSPQLVHALHPRVMVMNNGTRKGGQPDAMKVLHTSPGLEDLWQVHFSQLSGQEYTVPGMFIANTTDESPASLPIAPIAAPAPGPGAPPAPAHNGQAYWIKVEAHEDGSFSVTNARNGFSKTYAKP
jgi:beta-lactamase superfamily II metal-dependent hydrolase